MGRYDDIRKIKNVRDEKAFSLAEIIVAIAILAIGITSVMSLFPVGLNFQKLSEDKSTASNLAQLKFTEILMQSRSIYTGNDNLLTFASEYPLAGGDPAPFNEDAKYFWHYKVSTSPINTLNFVYRVDLAIYNIEGSGSSPTVPIQVFTSFLSLED